MIDPAESARLALHCMEAESVGPVGMPPVAAQEAQGAVVSGGPAPPLWMAGRPLLGWVSGQDSYFSGILNLSARRVFYGWAFGTDEGTEIVLRGTESAAEWAVNAEFLPMRDHAVRGRVETGFDSLFHTLEFRGLDGRDGPLGFTGAVTVTGHSLGAALATLVALDLAARGATVRGRFIASPHVGDAEFAEYFAGLVPDHAVYAYARDVVPKIPGALGYCHLPNLITLPVNARIQDSLTCNHHASSYAFAIHPESLDLLPPLSNPFASCISPASA